MIDNEKVKLMTQIAIYEKNEGREDLKMASFYQKDYISFNNFKMQLSLTFALLIVFGIEFAMILMDQFSTITINELIFAGIKYVVVWLVFMVFYTAALTRTNKKYYKSFKKRIEKYEKMLKDLGDM